MKFMKEIRELGIKQLELKQSLIMQRKFNGLSRIC